MLICRINLMLTNSRLLGKLSFFQLLSGGVGPYVHYQLIEIVLYD